jgi:hypothetical protein
MNKTLKWILIGLGVALAAFLIALPIFAMVFHRGSVGILGSGIFGRAGRIMMPVSFFSFFGFFRVLFPLGLLALAVTGIVLLVRGGKSSRATQPPAPPLPVQPGVEPHVCRKCGQPLYAGGEYCPFCGEKQ